MLAMALAAALIPLARARGGPASDAARSSAPVQASAPAPLFAPFQHAPLDGPLILTGSFGEYRPGRFHAGLDLSTGEVVGQPVYAPLDGSIERVRTSGVGYGRSLYLHVPDGRLIVLGHLDAFDDPIASYVAAAQDSSGQYEQDLWPESTRFRVHAGQRLGWSGRSGGVGQPHLHLEVRRGDMALNPLLAGASVEDSSTPVITAITFEPRTRDSRINGRFAPLRLMPGAAPETVRVEGYARVEVEARDPGPRRADMQPYEIEMRWGSHFVRCAFDSLSWATDMPEGPLLYDAGRIAPERRHAVLLWAPHDFRPRAISTDIPFDQEAGTLSLGAGGGTGAENVAFEVRDLAGRTATRFLTMRFEPIPFVDDSVGRPREKTFAPERMILDRDCRAFEGCVKGFGWLAVESCFGQGYGWDSVRTETLGGGSSTGDLVPIGNRLRISPRWVALRKPMSIRASVPVLHPGRQLGLYVRNGGDWELLTTEPDSTKPERLRPPIREGWVWLTRSDDEWARPSWIAHPTHLGEFSFFEDRLAPRITVLHPPRHRGSGTPYSHWALEARIREEGSGVNAHASAFLVDGRRRPTEWDAVDRKLRWKPRTPPARGTHRYVLIAADRAGNERRVSGTFVIN
jgi:murein DD-endopeptidase MepM/ murein hydrolase activator NlpD